MLPKALSFVDVETTGLSPRFDRIIEIGIVRVEDHKIVDEFTSLINPQRRLDPFITTMTGISPDELEDAPTFYEIKDQIEQVMKDTIFVAHVVAFDYGFIKSEYSRIEQSFNMKHFCSVRLARKLYPHNRVNNLDSIIERFNIQCERRHRAYDDAKVIWHFYDKSIQTLGTDKVASAIDKLMKRPSLPIGISEKVLDDLPESSGVYIFYDANGVILYIGKSKNIRDRVMSHFSNSKSSALEMKIAQSIKSIETIKTAGELGALLLESAMIKKHQPMYNRQLRHSYGLLALRKVITEEKYFGTKVEFLRDIAIDNLGDVLGVFKSQKQVKEHVHKIAKEHKLCLRHLGLEKTKGACFYYHLNQCLGACVNEENFLKYNLRFEEAFLKTKIKRWPFDGPIAIKEHGETEEIIVVDKWCILGTLKHEGDTFEEIQRDYAFDTDTYRILAKHLLNNNIQIISLQN